MKNRFTTLDLMASMHDLKQLEGMRVVNIYDINSKAYLIKLQKPDEKAVILFESGLRIHRTNVDWPKSQFPSSFSMKMRKHIKQKRLECISQLGVDRVVDMRFGDEDRAVHIIVELYDRGNILLTDHDYVILNILRKRTDKDTDVKLSVNQRYPIESARSEDSLPTLEQVHSAIENAKKGENLRRLLAPLTQLGGPLIDHVLFAEGFPHNALIGTHVAQTPEVAGKIFNALCAGQKVYEEIRAKICKGFISYKEDTRADGEKLQTYQDYHPFLFNQMSSGLYKEFPTFYEAIDDFYSRLDEQKQDQRALNMEREALKKLENVRKDQESRVQSLAEAQEKQKLIAERIIMNKDLVERALRVIQTAVASQLSWEAIEEMKTKAAAAGDQVAKAIVKLCLDSNRFVIRLPDPYDEDEPSVDASIDISLNAFQNSRTYFDDKKAAAVKVQKTLASAGKAIKNAHLKTKETLDKLEQVRIRVSKKRKAMWFEKFLWFISSENYIIVAGRDAQQNELLVKKYLRDGDIYVHADIRGAASVIIRNKAGRSEIPPKTLTEAAQMAVCYSNAWDAKVVANAWWVRHDQVSRTAPTGEYLSAGSFMIRGKKNYMPSSHLVMGFGILFRVDEESVDRHKDERKVMIGDGESVVDDASTVGNPEEELDLEEEHNEDEEKNENGEELQDEFPDVALNIKSLDVNRKNDEYSIIELNKQQPRGKLNAAKAKQQETAKYLEQKREEELRAAATNKGPSKHQKRKMEKIKKKYKDQDEEERELRMQLLGSRGKPKDPEPETATASNASTSAPSKPNNNRSQSEKNNEPQPKSHVESAAVEDQQELEAGKDTDPVDEDPEELAVDDSEGLLPFLTGKPYPEDGLLYAVPIVAPYQALNNFKYKVKLTPGTGKRGKAAKSALELFLRSKQGSQHEQVLLRSLIGDEASARNIPGKVRVSAPQLHAK